MRDIVFVTSNKSKVRETEQILGRKLQNSNIELDEIQELDPDKIAYHKLDQAFSKIRKPVIIDDISFEVNIWNGFPGPFIKWMLEAGKGPSVLLKMLEGQKNRRAVAKLIIGYHDGLEMHLFKGEIKGKVAEEARGENGFGWDQVFIPDGYKQTFAEMDADEKNKFSHRRIALTKLNVFLNQS